MVKKQSTSCHTVYIVCNSRALRKQNNLLSAAQSSLLALQDVRDAPKTANQLNHLSVLLKYIFSSLR